MEINFAELVSASISSVLFTIIGLVFFGISFLGIKTLVPFSIRKEIEEDQNVALGVILAAVIIGIAMIVSAALHG